MTLVLYAAAILILIVAVLVVLSWLPARDEQVCIYNAVDIARSPDDVFSFVTTPATPRSDHSKGVILECL